MSYNCFVCRDTPAPHYEVTGNDGEAVRLCDGCKGTVA